MGIVRGIRHIPVYLAIIALIFGSVNFIDDAFAQQSSDKKNNDNKKDKEKDGDREESQNRKNDSRCRNGFAPNVENNCVPIPKCNGLPATIIGTEERDKIKGTNGPDVIVAKGGNDKIKSGDGNDTICAGDGMDFIITGDGKDWIDAGSSRDIIRSGDDDDMIFARDNNLDSITAGDPTNSDFCQVDEKEKKIKGCEILDEPYGTTATESFDGGEEDDEDIEDE